MQRITEGRAGGFQYDTSTPGAPTGIMALDTLGTAYTADRLGMDAGSLEQMAQRQGLIGAGGNVQARKGGYLDFMQFAATASTEEVLQTDVYNQYAGGWQSQIDQYFGSVNAGQEIDRLGRAIGVRPGGAVSPIQARLMGQGIGLESTGAGLGFRMGAVSDLAVDVMRSGATDQQVGSLQSAMGQFGAFGLTDTPDAQRLFRSMQQGVQDGTGTRPLQSMMGYTNFLEGIGIDPFVGSAMAERFSQTGYDSQSQGRFQNVASQMVGMGVQSPIAANLASQTAGMSNMDFSWQQRLMGGDQLAYSMAVQGQNGLGNLFGVNMQAQGLRPLMDTQTGLGIFQEEQWGLQQQEHQSQFQNQMWGLGVAQNQLGMQRAALHGGGFVNPATGQRDSFQYGQYQIQDAQFNLGIRQNQFQFGMQERQQQMSEQRSQTGFGIQAHQDQKRYEWQTEDWSRSESQSQLSFGWAMEDFDEGIRFARGRERRLMQRRRDRSVVSESIRREGSEAQRERIDETRGWEKERFELQKKYYEEDTRLRREQMQKEREFFNERTEWQVRERDMGRKQQEIAMQLSQEELNRKKQLAQTNEEIWQREFQISQEITKRQAEMQMFYAQTLPQLLNQSGNLSGRSGGSSAPGPAPTPTSTVSSSYTSGVSGAMFTSVKAIGKMMSFDSGGYTGPGPKGDVRGVVHAGEYVIPQEGAPVIRGGDTVAHQKMDEMIRLLAAILQKAQTNVSISTNDVRGAMDYGAAMIEAAYGAQ
jgi:hypothetical protein